MLTLYNTLTRKCVPLLPIQSGKVSLYACGVTVYDYCHVGHARTYTMIDVMVRYLKWRGWEVTYVRNITDIDDKIIKRAQERQETVEEVTHYFSQAMHEDFAALYLTAPTDEPKATEYIPQMIALIQTLLQKKYAYQAENGDVYFSVRQFKAYGALSHHTLEKLASGIRIAVNEAKQDPLDFVLWKAEKPGEPSWETPFGRGRPGWHIECSAMSMTLLGACFDIHLGGRDLIFPHHENELAQSIAATDQSFANIWMHMGFLQMAKEKMSKSLGNVVTIREVLKKYSGEVLRYFLLSNHYRSPLVYSETGLLQSKQALSRLYTVLRDIPHTIAPPINTVFENQFIEAMDDDLNVPIALSVLFKLAHESQRLKENDSALSQAYGALLKHLGTILGLFQMDPQAFFQSSTLETDSVDQIKQWIDLRNVARLQKNWVEADRIRRLLAEQGIVIEDHADHTSWKIQ